MDLDPARRRPPCRWATGHRSHVGDEHRLARLEGALELGVAVQVHHVVPDARVFVARHQPHRLAAALRQEDGAAVEAEGLAQPPGDGLHDVNEMQRAGDFLEDLDHGQEVLALVLQLATRAWRRSSSSAGTADDGHEAVW